MTDIPVQYDFPYNGPLIIQILTSEEIIKICGINALACSWPPIVPGKTCVQFLPKVGPGGVGQRMRNYLVRWENARCNGWSDKNARVY